MGEVRCYGEDNVKTGLVHDTMLCAIAQLWENGQKR